MLHEKVSRLLFDPKLQSMFVFVRYPPEKLIIEP